MSEALKQKTESAPQVSPLEFLENFKPSKIDSSWKNDTDSPDRQHSINNLAVLIEQPLEALDVPDSITPLGTPKVDTLYHLKIKTEHPYGRGILRPYKTQYVKISDQPLSKETSIAKKIYDEAGPTDDPYKMWVIPRAEGSPLQIMMKYEGLFGDMDTSQGFSAIIDNKPASRADVEEVLNNVGSFFKSEHEHSKEVAEAEERSLALAEQEKQAELRQALEGKKGLHRALAMVAFKLGR